MGAWVNQRELDNRRAPRATSWRYPEQCGVRPAAGCRSARLQRAPEARGLDNHSEFPIIQKAADDAASAKKTADDAAAAAAKKSAVKKAADDSAAAKKAAEEAAAAKAYVSKQ